MENNLKAERKTGIGGTDIAGILGISPWRTPLDVWRDKVIGPEDIETPRMRWGTLLEPLIREEAGKALGVEVTGPEFIKDDWRIAHLDGRAGDAVLECKTAGSGDDWGEPGTDDIPDHYQTQLQWYMKLANLRRAYCAVLIGGSDFRIYEVPRDDGVVERITVVAEQFWRVNVLTETPPPVISLSDAKKLWRREFTGKVKPAAEMIELLERREARRLQLKALQEEQDRDETILRCHMEDCEGLIDEAGNVVVTLKTVKRDGYVVQPTEYRALRFTKWWNRRQLAMTQPKEIAS